VGATYYQPVIVKGGLAWLLAEKGVFTRKDLGGKVREGGKRKERRRRWRR
jgi:hypothetical protein